MIFVIQCAAQKKLDAGRFKTSDGNDLLFVAHPELAPHQNKRTYAHPDDLAPDGLSWRDKLIKINEQPKTDIDTLELLPAWELYKNPTYANLVNKFGAKKIFILSAGWGLVPSDFLLPKYDITFSLAAPKHNRRYKIDAYKDFNYLSALHSEHIVYLGGKDYIQLFDDLTNKVTVKRIIVYNSVKVPQVENCEVIRYDTTTRTNWHYECARDIISGNFLNDLERLIC